jgi:O-antigen ligase
MNPTDRANSTATSTSNDGAIPALGRGAYDWLVALTLAGYPLIAGVGLWLDVDARMVSVPFRAVVVFLAVVSIVSTFRQNLVPRRSWRWGGLALFWFLYLSRLAYDFLWNNTRTLVSPELYWLFAVGVTLLPMMGAIRAASVVTLDALERTIWRVQFAAAVVAVTGILAAAGRGATSAALATGRFGIEALNPISVGQLGGALLLLSTHRLLRPRATGVRRNMLAIVAAALGLVILVGSGSRGPIAATSVALIVLALVSRQFRGMRSRIPALIVLAAVLSTGWVLAQRVNETLGVSAVERVAALADPAADEGSRERILRLKNGFAQFAEHPIIGSGIVEQTTQDYPHNVAIEAFMATGLLGGLVFVGLIAGALALALASLRNQSAETTGWLPLLMVQSVILSLTSGAIAFSADLWCLLAIVYSQSAGGPRRA